jgi:hypothetical protein
VLALRALVALSAVLCLAAIARAQDNGSAEGSDTSLQCAAFACSQADPSCGFTTFSGDGRQASFRVNNNSRVCVCELSPGDRFCVSSNGQFPGSGCEQREVRGFRPSCVLPAGTSAQDNGPVGAEEGSATVAAPGAGTSPDVGAEPSPDAASSGLQCATFTCREADPFCAYTTFGDDGRQASFRVNNEERVCFCELRPGDRFCVGSDGQFPGAGCAQREVRGLRPTCVSPSTASAPPGGSPEAGTADAGAAASPEPEDGTVTGAGPGTGTGPDSDTDANPDAAAAGPFQRRIRKPADDADSASGGR